MSRGFRLSRANRNKLEALICEILGVLHDVSTLVPCKHSSQNPQQRDSQIDCHSDVVSVHNEATSLWQSTDWGIVFVDSKYLPFYPSVNVKSKCAEHNDKIVKILGKSEKSTLGNKCVITKLNFKEKKKNAPLFCHCNSIYGAPGIDTAILLAPKNARARCVCV